MRVPNPTTVVGKTEAKSNGRKLMIGTAGNLGECRKHHHRNRGHEAFENTSCVDTVHDWHDKVYDN